MKRLVGGIGACALLLLAACGAAENPMVVVSDAGQKMAAEKSLKFDFTGHIKLHMDYPAAAGSANSLKAFRPTDSDQKLDGTGAALLPDRVSLDARVAQGDSTSRMRMIATADTTYMTIPTTGAWVKLPVSWKQGGGAAGGATGINQLDPTSSEKLLKGAKSVTDLGEETVGGVRSHHYRLYMDGEKLKEAINAESASSAVPGAAAAAQNLDIKDYRVETWIGVVDHLTHRMLTDYSMSIVRTAPAQAQLGADYSPLKVSIMGHMVMNFHDFGAPVTIQPPADAQDFSTLFGSAAGSSGGAKVTVQVPAAGTPKP